MIGFAAFIAVIVAVVAVPVALYSAISAVNHVFSRNSGVLPIGNPELETRLQRMEEAIDAMSQQVERLRASSESRYVPADADRPLQLPPDDSPPER